MNEVIYNFDGGGGAGGPCGWGWVCNDGTAGCGALKPGTTSNVAEYTAFTQAIHDALSRAKDSGDNSFLFRGDSMLVVQQVNGRWKVNKDHLRPLVNNAQMLLAGLPEWALEWVPRTENSKADEQAWIGKTMWNALHDPSIPEVDASGYTCGGLGFKRGWPE